MLTEIENVIGHRNLSMSCGADPMICTAPKGQGVSLRIKFDGHRWMKGKLEKRVVGSKNHAWQVNFDDGTCRDDIWFGNTRMFAIFEESAYGEQVEVLVQGSSWLQGTLITLINGDGFFGIDFEDGDWTEDVEIFSPFFRYKDAEKEESRQKARKKHEEAERAQEGAFDAA